MLKSKEYNFEVLFEKIELAKKDSKTDTNYIDENLLREVDKDIESLRGYIEAINESQYQTFSRS
jgi:hypothetical protein